MCSFLFCSYDLAVESIASCVCACHAIGRDATTMVKHLLAANKKTLDDLRTARDLAAEVGDCESEDLMISRIQVHEKTVWMLKSFLG